MSVYELHSTAMLLMIARQQCSAPPGKLPQSSPPHWPHVLSQQTPPPCANTPLAHQVELTNASVVAWSDPDPETPRPLLFPVAGGSAESPSPAVSFSAGGCCLDRRTAVSAFRAPQEGDDCLLVLVRNAAAGAVVDAIVPLRSFRAVAMASCALRWLISFTRACWGTRQAVSVYELHSTAMLLMIARQQCSPPPGKLPQSSPPHWPHVLSQQTPPSCASTPLAHQVEPNDASVVA